MWKVTEGILLNTTNWFELPEEQFNELIKLGNMYRREALKCHEAKAYVAACTCAGAALETMLIAITHLFGEEVEAAGHVVKRRGKCKPLLNWTLRELLITASAMNWLPRGLADNSPWISRQAKIGDYVEALRQTRNLIHPARYIEDHSPHRVTHRYAEHYREILDAAVRYLGAIVEESLLKALDDSESGQ